MKAGALMIVMGGALHWEKLSGVLDSVGVTEGDKSRGAKMKLGGAGIFCSDKWNEILPKPQSINQL